MMIQSGRVRWAQYEVLLKWCNTGKKMQSEVLKGRSNLEDLDVDTWVILELI
jgi:hypothetical protein